ncbi:dihydropteroate synthase [Aquirufa sp.]|uniref:dihydropteroate synthase n=1 Tax=Aquirufa sp. TaxID=2676249 RepID=UPI003782FF46
MDALFSTSQTIRLNGQLIDFSAPKIMGILNITPDSFFEGSRVSSVEAALQQASSMIDAGALILDIGGHSTRPGAAPVSLEEEIERVCPIISAISDAFPSVIISIDTYRVAVAREALAAGAHLFNDIGAGQMDEGVFDFIVENQVPYILSHSIGRFEQVHEVPDYQNVVAEVLHDLLPKVQELRSRGFKDLIVDPGFGFSKALDHNYSLLAHLRSFKLLGAPILAGLSRKTMIWKELGITADEALNGTTVLHTIALQQGASILRVHDVKEAKETIHLVQKLQQNGLSHLL